MYKAPECGLAKSAESELTRGAERIAADILGGIRIRAAAETNTVIAGREADRRNCKDDGIDLASLLWRELVCSKIRPFQELTEGVPKLKLMSPFRSSQVVFVEPIPFIRL